MVIWITPVMDTTEVGIWSSKHYLIAANVSILLNVMLIFRKVTHKSSEKPDPCELDLNPRKRI